MATLLGKDGYLVGKELIILLFVCVVGKCFVVFYVFSFPPAVYVGTINLIASIPGPSILTFARVCNHVTDFNARNKCLTAKLLQQGYRYHQLRKPFSKFYRRHYEWISKYNLGLNTLLKEGLSEPKFYGDLVYKF